MDVQINSEFYKINKLNEEQLGIAQNLVIENGFEVANAQGQRLTINRHDCLIDGYKALLDLVERSDELTNLAEQNPLFMDRIINAGHTTFFSSASVIKLLVDNGMGHVIKNNHRAILYADSQDGLITKGQSDEITPEQYESGQYWREHVVPCKVIAEHAMQMAANGASVEEMAEFIERHLIIILITIPQQHRVDVELGLRDSMPQGWEQNGDIYERLNVAGIAYTLYDSEL